MLKELSNYTRMNEPSSWDPKESVFSSSTNKKIAREGVEGVKNWYSNLGETSTRKYNSPCWRITFNPSWTLATYSYWTTHGPTQHKEFTFFAEIGVENWHSSLQICTSLQKLLKIGTLVYRSVHHCKNVAHFKEKSYGQMVKKRGRAFGQLCRPNERQFLRRSRINTDQFPGDYKLSEKRKDIQQKTIRYAIVFSIFRSSFVAYD